MIILKDGEYAVFSAADTILLFSFDSMGYQPETEEENIFALDDRCQLTNDRRHAMSLLCEYKKKNPQGVFFLAYDGDKTVVILGSTSQDIPEGYIGPYDNPDEALCEADDIRRERLRTAQSGQ